MIALSTAFKTAQIAIDIRGKQSFKEMDASCKVSENVLSTLDGMLEDIGEKIQNNDTYAVVVGPGSFTGLRIGIALVKGLCAGGSNKKVIPLSSLSLIAYAYIKQRKPQSQFLSVLNALSGLYFVCEFDANGNKVGEERLITQAEQDKLALPKVGLKEENLPIEQVEISAQDLLEFAVTCEKSGKFVDFHTLTPLYLRRSQAEVSLDEKNNKKV